MVSKEKHEVLGEVPVARLVKKECADITVAQLIMYCRKYLEDYKIPVRMEFVGQIEKTILGKACGGMLLAGKCPGKKQYGSERVEKVELIIEIEEFFCFEFDAEEMDMKRLQSYQNLLELVERHENDKP